MEAILVYIFSVVKNFQSPTHIEKLGGKVSMILVWESQRTLIGQRQKVQLEGEYREKICGYLVQLGSSDKGHEEIFE